MRTGWFRQACIKSESCYRTRLLLTHRRNLKAEVPRLENAIRHSLKSFGIRLRQGRTWRHRTRGTSGGGGRSVVGRADGRHADGARGAVATVLPAA